MQKNKLSKELEEELNALHSAVMSIEELLVKKGVVNLKELNSSIKKSYAECKKNRRKGKRIKQS